MVVRCGQMSFNLQLVECKLEMTNPCALSSSNDSEHLLLG